MQKNYIDGDGIRFKKAGLCAVDMETAQGDAYKNLMPKRLFPTSRAGKYISLLDEEQKEVAIIRDLNALTPESKAIVEDALNAFYFIPQITKIYGCTVRFGLFKFDVETDKGRIQFDMGNLHYNIKRLQGTRILFRDMNDNRYEIADYTKLDKKSAHWLYPYI